MPRTGRLASLFRMPRRMLRVQLALLYAGFFFACGVAVLLVPILTVHQSIPEGANAAAITQIQADSQGQVIRAAVTLFGLGVLSLAVGWLISGRFLRPLRTITATARDISASNLDRRVALGGRADEFRELGETLDSLFGRLEASFESQRRFVANASHELRTPLTAERTLLQVALADPDADAETLRTTCQELLVLGEEQEHLIEALLTLASSERGVDRWDPFDLAEVAGKVITDRRQEAERRGIRLGAALSAAPATGDPSLAESLVANLVDNALRHNRAGGQIDIATKSSTGQAVVSVGNTGQPITPDEVDRLFQPFQRLGSERTGHDGGHGLGLAIVRAIASAHGATMTAKARPEGGLDIEVSFHDRSGDAAAGQDGNLGRTARVTRPGHRGTLFDGDGVGGRADSAGCVHRRADQEHLVDAVGRAVIG
jgi:signal transduction histidine kinase